MSKKFKKIILALSLIVLILVTIFVYKNYLREKFLINLPKEHVESTMVYIDEIKLAEGDKNFIYSSTLIPVFKIVFPKNAVIESMRLQIDETRDVLRDEFYGETNLDTTNREFIFRPSYMFLPEKHQLVIEYRDLDGNLLSKTFNFVFVFSENFDKTIKDSNVWIVPEGRSSEWFNVKNGKLLAQPATEDGHSSLAFLYSFPGDITVDFELIPIGNNVSLVFYFLDSKSFVIGSDSNNRVILLRKGEAFLNGKSFKLLSEYHYHVRIVRKNCDYQLFIKELIGDTLIDSTMVFSDNDKVIDYTNCTYKSDRIGFSVWQNSNGIFIDNIFITGFSSD